MNTENLVKMANDIGNFFNAEPNREAAVHSIADHLKKFWDPRMRRAIIDHYRAGGVGMSEEVRAAVGQLEEEAALLMGTGDG